MNDTAVKAAEGLRHQGPSGARTCGSPGAAARKGPEQRWRSPVPWARWSTWQQVVPETGRGPQEETTMGLTLIEAQKYARRAEQLAVLKTFAEGEVLRRLPFKNLQGGSLSFPAEVKLPRVGFRAVNEGYRQSYGVVQNDNEYVHLFGGDLDVDRSIVDLQGPEARAAQTEMKVRSMRLTLEAGLINGDDLLDPRVFGDD